jgi:hypothetical protein
VYKGGVSNDSPFFWICYRCCAIEMILSQSPSGLADHAMINIFLVPLTASFRIYEEKNLFSHENKTLR